MAVITRKTVRSIALPAEHGGWSFWLEPILLGMLVASSGTGFALVILSLASFMMRQPLKVALIDLRKKKFYLRTRLAICFVVIYGFIGGLALLASLSGGGMTVLLPLIPAYIVALAQVLIFDIRGESRHWLPEVLGTVVMSAFAVSIALAGGWMWTASLILASIIVARSIPTIFYVRTQLRQIKSQAVTLRWTILLHVVAVGVMTGLAIANRVPVLTVVAMMILLVRAIVFMRQNASVPAKTIGIQEIIFGLIVILLSAIGYTNAI